MKIKNMENNYQSTYQTLIINNKRKLTNNSITGIIALAIALLASFFSNSIVICIFCVLSLVLSGGEIFSKFIKAAKNGKFDDTALIIIAVLIPFFLGRFVIAAFAMSIYKLLGTLISYLFNELGITFKSFAEVTPEFANLVDSDSNIRKVESKTLVKGAKIMIKAGETVPVDCVIVDGFSDFDTSNICGSKKNESFSSGDKLLAGFVNNSSSVTCEAICNFEDSIVMDLNRLTTMAEKKNTKVEKRFMSIAKWYPVAILAIAIIMLLISGFSTGVWTNAMLKTSVLLTIATSGSYLLAAPLISSCALWNMKKKGLAISSGDLIDEIADINVVAFEKNGILTNREYKIQDIYTAEGISEEDFLMIAGNCLGGRPHPIAQILTKYMNPYIPAENIMEFPGKGMECTIMEKSFVCGSEHFMKECNIDISDIHGHTIYISIDGVIMGAMTVQDSIKSNSGESLRNLRQIGVKKLVMLSSERKETAELAYSDCGADEYFAEISPYNRAEIVQKLKNEDDATCAYIGDAVNGTQAIDAADVGIMLVGKEENGLEFSKAILLGDLNTLADSIEISRLACGKTELHFYCASAVKIILMLLALFGAINVVSAIVVDALLSIAAILSAKDLITK